VAHERDCMKAILKILASVLGGLGLIVLALYLTVIEFWTVPSDDAALTASIVPTLAAGDFLVVAKDSIPDISDLVRCTDPDAPERFVVGRVFARNGDPVQVIGDIANSKQRRQPSPRRCGTPTYTVATKDGDTRDLECWEENYDGTTFHVMRGADRPSQDFSGVAEQGKFFLVSDNRTLHLDSRDFGQVEPHACRRVYVRLWGAAGITEPHFEWVF
jgi:signal peptidase I